MVYLNILSYLLSVSPVSIKRLKETNLGVGGDLFDSLKIPIRTEMTAFSIIFRVQSQNIAGRLKVVVAFRLKHPKWEINSVIDSSRRDNDRPPLFHIWAPPLYPSGFCQNVIPTPHTKRTFGSFVANRIRKWHWFWGNSTTFKLETNV